MLIPIAYHGREELEHRQLQIQIYKADIEVTGKPANMPDVIIVDISKKVSGDTITSADLSLPAAVKLHETENEIYAVIKAVKEVVEEEPEAEAAAEEVTPA